MAATTILDPAQLQMLMGSYGIGKARCLSDPFLALKAQGYRRNLGSRMMALDKPLAKERLPECDSYVSRKVDGECTILLIDGMQCCSVNPGGVVRHGLPFMQEAVELLAKSNHKQALVAGELYLARTDRRPRVHDVSRAARQPESQADLDSLHFAIFDLIELDGKNAPASYASVHKQIESIFKSGKRIRPVDTIKTKNLGEVMKAFDGWVEKEGAEGIVVRSDTAGLFKIKPRITVDAAVLGFTEGTNGRTGMLHDMLLGLMRKDETFHVLGRVGGGFSDDQRREWLSDLKDMSAESDYAEVNDSVAYQMVRPEWVVEISVLDLINQNTRGGSVDRMVLEFNNKGNAYKSIRRLPLASPISPVFMRRREDKSVRADDLRLQQVADVIEVPMMDSNARQLELAKSALIRREVYTKTIKGNLMVRKLLLWQTNKATEGGSHPAFVAYFTDFSPNRATPLERDIRISNSREQIEQLYAGLKEENIVKGWAPAA
jgi:hypothetical protein